MALNLAADLAIMLSADDFGLAVQFGALTTSGHLNREVEEIDGGGQMVVKGTAITLTYAWGSLPGLKKGSAITVAGEAFKVRFVEPQDDGMWAKAYLEKP